MTDWRYGGETARRRGTWMPCPIQRRFEEMAPAEKVAALRETKWCDRLTDRQWESLLERDGTSEADRKRTAGVLAEFVLVLAHACDLNSDVVAAAIRRARATYEQQYERPLRWARIASALAGQEFTSEDSYRVHLSFEEIEDEDDDEEESA